MKLTRRDYLGWKNRRVTLLGMSGVGKTMLASLLPWDKWFHYSGDYRIGTRYLDEAILDQVKLMAMQHPYLKAQLRKRLNLYPQQYHRPQSGTDFRLSGQDWQTPLSVDSRWRNSSVVNVCSGQRKSAQCAMWIPSSNADSRCMDIPISSMMRAEAFVVWAMPNAGSDCPPVP